MPTKTTPAGREYDVDGKRFTWHPLDDDDQPGTLPDVVLPLRIKLGVLRSLSGRDLDADGMFAMLEALAPDQSDTLDEMDVADFQAMFSTWQAEYQALSGAALGESSGSSS
jgi:hypothetical protein